MISIRTYRESDAENVGRLIADTYGDFNLDFASPDEKQKLLGPFQHARSTDEAHRAAIAEALREPRESRACLCAAITTVAASAGAWSSAASRSAFTREQGRSRLPRRSWPCPSTLPWVTSGRRASATVGASEAPGCDTSP